MTSLPNSLPSYLTTFVGRDAELRVLEAALGEHSSRLVTVTGPAGVGKTRLAVEAVDAWAATGKPESEVLAFIDGAAIERAGDVLPAIAVELGVGQEGSAPNEAISEFLSDRTTLLVLDNLEHLTGAATDISALLRACPGLRVLATSRMPLRLSGECLLALDPLETVPDRPDGWSPAALLFLDRARMADRSIDRASLRRETVDTIVARVDGIPLAIELAAARLRILSPEALAALLTRQLAVLTDGPHDTAPRHRTLQQAIDWSFQLLDTASRSVMLRLGIFPESFSLEAIEAICLAEVDPRARQIEALAIVTELFDQGLVQRVLDDQSASPRFRMLTSIRDFARDRLLVLEDYPVTVRCFIDYFVPLAEFQETRLLSPESHDALELLARDMPNLRQVFPLSIECGDPFPALRLIGALWRYWEVRGPLPEASHLIQQTFAHFEVRPEPMWGAALRAAAIVAELLTDWEHALRWNLQAIEVWEALDDRGKLARSLIDLANVYSSTGEFALATGSYERALDLAQEVGDRRSELIALTSIANVALRAGEIERAVAGYEAALGGFRIHRDPVLLAIHLSNFGVALGWLGQRERALELLEESLLIRRELGDDQGIAHSLINIEECQGRASLGGANAAAALEIGRRLDSAEILGVASTNLALGAIGRGDLAGAAGWLIDALQLHVSNPSSYTSEVIGAVAEVAERADPDDAAQLLGAATQLRDIAGVPWSGHHAERLRELDGRLEAVLGPDRFAETIRRGAGLDQQQAILLATAVVRRMQRSAPVSAVETGGTEPERRDPGLTPRELVVLRLIASGRTDREIAEELFISRKTASHHVTSILAKLECRNRAGATALAFRLGIAEPS